MIRFVSNSITDQLGRSNFVDSNGLCVGLKEFPDGNPLLWTTVPWSSNESDPKLEEPPDVSAIKPRCSLRSFLDGSCYIFGYVAVEKSDINEGVEFAKIRLVRDDCEAAAGLILYIVISKPDDLYFADFKMSIDDRKKLFGNMDSLKGKIRSLQLELGRLTKIVDSMRTIVDVMEYEQKITTQDS